MMTVPCTALFVFHGLSSVLWCIPKLCEVLKYAMNKLSVMVRGAPDGMLIDTQKNIYFFAG